MTMPHKGVYRGIGGGYGKPGAAFLSFPILMGQNRSDCKEPIKDGAAIFPQRSKFVIGFQARAVYRVSSGVQKIFVMPFRSLFRLPDIQIENRLPDMTSASMQPPA